jgi:hypothetical protein
MERIPLEAGLVVGTFLILAGIAGSAAAVRTWQAVSFGNLEPREVLRVVIPAILALMLGGQMILGSFVLGVLALGRK